MFTSSTRHAFDASKMKRSVPWTGALSARRTVASGCPKGPRRMTTWSRKTCAWMRYGVSFAVATGAEASCPPVPSRQRLMPSASISSFRNSASNVVSVFCPVMRR